MSKAGNSLLEIGRVLKSNGVDGEVLVNFRDIDLETVDLQEPVFIEFDGLPVPFFIASFHRRGNFKALIRLVDVESFEDASELEGRNLYIRESSLMPMEYEEGDFSFLEGWTLYNDGVKVGVISLFNDIPGNPCIEADTENGSVMVPLHDDFILGVDEDTESLYMSLPSGLIP